MVVEILSGTAPASKVELYLMRALAMIAAATASVFMSLPDTGLGAAAVSSSPGVVKDLYSNSCAETGEELKSPVIKALYVRGLALAGKISESIMLEILITFCT